MNEKPATTQTTISEIEILIVNRPITDNRGEAIETINLTSQNQNLVKEQFERAFEKATVEETKRPAN